MEKGERIVVNDQEREHVMKQFIKQFPLPVCGLALGLASSGNLLQTYGIGELKGLCGALAAVLLFFMLLKGICFANVLKEELKNPALAGISATFPMALMILSTCVFGGYMHLAGSDYSAACHHGIFYKTVYSEL